MVRVEKSQSNNGKKPSKSSDCENEYMTTSESNSRFHQQNLYIVSFPIIVLFNILRSILYQVFIIFKYIFNISLHYLYQPIRKRHTNRNISVNSEKVGQSTNSNQISVVMISRPQHLISPGPGDPLLAKQKHHHRRAFEYISKALKIDEENEG